jgi:hypothetical protein
MRSSSFQVGLDVGCVVPEMAVEFAVEVPVSLVDVGDCLVLHVDASAVETLSFLDP